MKERYEEIKLLIADQVRDDELNEAAENFEELNSLKEGIEQIENLDVKIIYIKVN